jgi:hypothetical protein
LILLQVADEVKSVLEFVEYAYKIFDFTFELELSTVLSYSSFHPLQIYKWDWTRIGCSLVSSVFKHDSDLMDACRDQRNFWVKLKHGTEQSSLWGML